MVQVQLVVQRVVQLVVQSLTMKTNPFVETTGRDLPTDLACGTTRSGASWIHLNNWQRIVRIALR